MTTYLNTISVSPAELKLFSMLIFSNFSLNTRLEDLVKRLDSIADYYCRNDKNVITFQFRCTKSFIKKSIQSELFECVQDQN